MNVSRLACLVAVPVLLAVPQTPANSDGAEVATREETPTFQTGVTVVSVPVVVRDANGKAVGNLTKDNFQVFDRGKPQVITRFSVETPDTPPPQISSNSELEQAAGGAAAVHSDPQFTAQRFTAYLFDDVHLIFGDLAQVRDAAMRHLQEALRPTDRAAIFTTSGQTTLDFTADQNLLRTTLNQLRPRPIARGAGSFDCPNLTFYMADAIENKNDPMALQTAIAETKSCLHTDQDSVATPVVHGAARRVLDAGEQETQVTLQTVRDVIRRLAVSPGTRTIVFASPGFFVPTDLRFQESETMDRAIRANVVLSTLDARGLYTVDPLGDISAPSVNPAVASRKAQYELQSASADEDILAELASATGGGYFHNSNDLHAGFAKLAASPAVIYVLSFTPDKLKMDGAFHPLKVKLVGTAKLEAQSRRGYYAPKHSVSAEDAAKEQIEEELFSREELRNDGVDLQTQFFKVSDAKSNLSVVAHVTLKRVPFNKVEGRNRNVLTVVSAVFDRNGNFIKAEGKTVDMKLRDETLVKVPRITVKTDFDVPPGGYAVRLVVRDSSGQMLVAENGTVEIPY